MDRRSLIFGCFLFGVLPVFSDEPRNVPVGPSFSLDDTKDIPCLANAEENGFNLTTKFVPSSFGCKSFSTPFGNISSTDTSIFAFHWQSSSSAILGSSFDVMGPSSDDLGSTTSVGHLSTSEYLISTPPDIRKGGSLEDPRIRQTIYFIGYGIYLPCLAVACVIGNSLTLTVLHQGALKSSTSAFFMALAVSDVFLQIAAVPHAIQAYPSLAAQPTAKSVHAFWLSYGFPFVYTFLTSSIWITVCLTIERFICVCYPIKAKAICTKRRAKIAVTSVFLLSILANSPHFFVRTPSARTDFQTNTTYYESELTVYGRTAEINAALFWSKFIISVAIPFVTLALVNCCIIRGLRKARRFNESIQQSQRNDLTSNSVISRDIQITRMLTGIVACFFFSYTCSAVASLIVATSGTKVYADGRFMSFVIVSNLLSNTNAVLNFAMYTACSVSIRRAILRLLCPRRQKTVGYKDPSPNQG